VETGFDVLDQDHLPRTVERRTLLTGRYRGLQGLSACPFCAAAIPIRGTKSGPGSDCLATADGLARDVSNGKTLR
jgi:hypothetical protein